MMGNYRLTPRALEDLKSIGRYTLRQWGVRQRNQYLQDLDQRFKWLVEQPQLGKHRSDIERGYFCYIFTGDSAWGIILFREPTQCQH